MIVKIHARGFTLSNALRNYTDSKVRLALGLFEDKIQRSDIVLMDVNGPKGGKDMMCKIKIKLNRHTPFMVQETAYDMYDAINICSHRVKRAAHRRLHRARYSSRMSLKSSANQRGPVSIGQP